MKDPIVEEVRAHRMAHTLRFGGNITRICEDLRALEQAGGYRVVRLPAKKIPGATYSKTPGGNTSRESK